MIVTDQRRFKKIKLSMSIESKEMLKYTVTGKNIGDIVGTIRVYINSKSITLTVAGEVNYDYVNEMCQAMGQLKSEMSE